MVITIYFGRMPSSSPPSLAVAPESQMNLERGDSIISLNVDKGLVNSITLLLVFVSSLKEFYCDFIALISCEVKKVKVNKTKSSEVSTEVKQM